MSEMLTTLGEVCDILEKPSLVLILTHTRPDADTLGCAAALREMLISLGKRAEIVNDDDIPRRLKFIFGKEPDDEFDLRPERLTDFEPDMIVSVDVSASKLLGKLEEPCAERTYLAIDHHALGTPFAEKTYVGALGACGEIICDLAKEFEKRGKKTLDREGAIALYAAIMSDTGSFRFDSVTAETHMRIASLLGYGFDHSEVARRMYDSRPLSQVMGTKVALNDLHFYNGNRVAVINFTKKMREDNNLSREDIDDIISLTRSIEGVEVGMTIKQSDDDLTLYKVSMRSNRVVDVSKLCAVFGGGGHKRASGCTLNAASEYDAEARLMAVINEELAALDKARAFDGAGEI